MLTRHFRDRIVDFSVATPKHLTSGTSKSSVASQLHASNEVIAGIVAVINMYI